MRIFFYKFLIGLSRILGTWIFAVFAWFVASGYFMLFPSRVGNSIRFYRRLFPERSRFYHLWCAWRQFHNFTHVFFDRFMLQEFDDVSATSQGLDNLRQACRPDRGGILLMSHMGNWEVAAHLLKRKLGPIRILLYMGIKYKEQLERIQKESLSESGISIIGVEETGGSPMDIIEGVKFIETGGVVSMTGDLVWKKDQRAVPVKLLEQDVLLPEAPYLLALLSGAPLLVFFAFRTGKRRYHFTMSEPIYIEAPSRHERKAAIQRAAQRYADILEETLRRQPLQWYHFEPFFERAGFKRE